MDGGGMRTRNDEVKVLASIIAWFLAGVIVALALGSSFNFWLILIVWTLSLAALTAFYYLLDEFEKRVR